MGETCLADSDCSSSNCSTDGDITMVGHCNQALGSSCEPGSDAAGSHETATCTNCYQTFFAGGGVCLRRACDLENAPTCPSFGGHDFNCAMSTSGGYNCFERCEDEFDSCFNALRYCYRAGDYCR